MANAGKLASAEAASDALYRDYRRFNLPRTVNDYAALTISRQWDFQIAGDPPTADPLLRIPSTGNDMNSLHFVRLDSNAFADGANTSKPYQNLTYNNLRAGSTMATNLHNIYDSHRVRCMKLIFESPIQQPLTNTESMDIYVWLVPNIYDLGADLSSEYASFQDLRADMGDKRLYKICHSYGKTFSMDIIPNVTEGVNLYGSEQFHPIPYPWCSRGQGDLQMWTPILIFRRPFRPNQPANFVYTVTLKACLEFKDPNPNDEN